MEVTAATLASGGGILVAAYAAIQFGRFVTAITSFLEKLHSAWQAEEMHRHAEVQHWAELLERLPKLRSKRPSK